MLSYLQLDDLLGKIDEPYQSKCRQIVSENLALFERSRGSSNNHQAWTGGYIDHLHEVMNLAVRFYSQMNDLRPLSFFCHMCDVASARLWYDYPQEHDDPWPGAKRFCAEV